MTDTSNFSKGRLTYFCVSKTGYHNRLAEKSDRHKQSLWVVIRILKDEERLVKMAIKRVDMGFPAPPRKLKYRRLEKRIKQLKREYRRGDKTLEQYWSAVTYCTVQY